MALWDKITSRGEVEDRRGMAPAAVGGLGLGGVALLFLVTYLSGGSMSDALQQLVNSAPAQYQQQPVDTSQYEGKDSYEVFVSEVLGSANDMWKAQFSQLGDTYTEPKLVLFRTATDSACGGATSDVGPHYCPLDQTIYLDETFFDELTSRFGAKGGDVAQAYVIAHEVGHHAQQELGIMQQEQRAVDDNPNQTNALSIKLELQADCYAGLWAHSVRDRGVVQPDEINEAIDAAAAVGDDRIQKKVTGQITPETWTHGSSEERVHWFTTGYDTGSLQACDTFK